MDRKRVWILGAGFSRSLGGPLLPDLLSRASYDDVRTIYRNNRRLHDTDAARLVYWTYNAGRKDGDGAFYEKFGNNRFGTVWANAEEFLDYLDSAAAGGHRSQTLNERLGEKNIGFLVQEMKGEKSPLHLLRDSACRLLAAECCVFLNDVDREVVRRSERWRPYLRWAMQLDASDTIITTNYDRVIESMMGGVSENVGFKIIADPEDEIDAAQEGTPRVLKLHGSVDWRTLPEPKRDAWRFERTSDREFALTCSPGELAIATPGPTKRTATKLFKPLWVRAAEALKQATDIYLVGYRFPPTDAEARERLLDAIVLNERNTLNLHTVLGPFTTDAWTTRTEHLLRYAALKAAQRVGKAGWQVVVHPLLAEDFFTVWEPEK